MKGRMKSRMKSQVPLHGKSPQINLNATTS
jgi:hypothetical protein